MSSKTVDFYFDYLSPWAYFAWVELKEKKLFDQYNFRFQPVPYPNLSMEWQQRAIATLPSKRLFIYKFAYRYAVKNNIPYSFPAKHPYKPYTSLRMSMKTVSGEQQFKLINTLFQACWVDRVDLGSDAEIRTYLDSHGLDGSLFLSSVSRPEIKIN